MPSDMLVTVNGYWEFKLRNVSQDKDNMSWHEQHIQAKLNNRSGKKTLHEILIQSLCSGNESLNPI